MRQFTIAAAIIATAALISAASAESLQGGPVQQNGKCWHGEKHSSSADSSFGYWESCAERASRGGRRGGGVQGQAGGAVQGGGAVQATSHRRI